MGQSAKNQTFPYSFKTVTLGDKNVIGYGSSIDRIGFQIISPKDFYSCQQLYAHLRFTADGTQAGRNITSVYVTDTTISPTWTRTITTSYTADGSLTVDAKVDVTPLRNEFGDNIVFFVFNGIVSGTIKVMKLDMLYQVIGVR